MDSPNEYSAEPSMSQMELVKALREAQSDLAQRFQDMERLQKWLDMAKAANHEYKERIADLQSKLEEITKSRDHLAELCAQSNYLRIIQNLEGRLDSEAAGNLRKKTLLRCLVQWAERLSPHHAAEQLDDELEAVIDGARDELKEAVVEKGAQK